MMPLDHTNGERLEGMDLLHRVVPKSKYHELPGLATLVEVEEGKKFKRKVQKLVPIVAAADNYAMVSFIKAGAPAGPLHYDVIVQEYPMTGKVVFVYCAKINGVEKYAVAPFQLTSEQIAEMKAIDQWQDVLVN